MRYRRTTAELAEPVACIDCGHETQTPRRQRCTRCYWRHHRRTRGEVDARCIDCGTDDPAVLVGTREGPRCLNCRALAQQRLLSA
ncbi:MAG TPA: hypothetical protein VF420_13265 [Casimicrobiaceae bacterium]